MSIDLTARSGPLKGRRFSIDDGAELVIGRTTRGVNLPDPTVSVKHARVVGSSSGFTLEDLDSATGTTLNGDPLAAGRPTFIDVGDVVVIGETTFLVGSGRARALRRVFMAMVPAWGMVLVAATLVFWVTGERPATLGLSSPIRTHEGPVDTLTFPFTFLRANGITVDELGLRQVTDMDGDGIDELWLQVADREVVVTFGRDGAWQLLAELPHACHVRGEGEPDIQCGDVTYRRLDGKFVEVSQEHPVVWLQGALTPPAPASPDAPPPPVPEGGDRLNAGQLVPYRVAAQARDRIAGFLGERGVTKPVHYIICEGAIPGIEAQAVTQEGEAIPLGFGCGKAVELLGSKAASYAGARAAVIALSAQGRARVADNVSYALSGSEEPLFLDDAQAEVVQQLRAWPIDTRGALQIAMGDTPHVFPPMATGLLGNRVPLVTSGPRPPDVVSARILEPGDAILDIPGCSKLQIHTPPFRCALLRGCLPGFSFVRVRDIGCGDAAVNLVDSGYDTAVWGGRSDQVEVRVQVESRGSFALRDVVRARVGARPIAPAP